MYPSKHKNNLTTKGFALVELLVSISILILVLGTIMFRHSAFNSAVLLRSQAYEVALQARDTQLFAVGIVSDAGNYKNRYGLHFTENSITYKIFRDNNLNSYFNSGEEFGQQGNLDSRFVISDIRWVQNDGTTKTSISNVSVLFERPNFDAKFYTGAAPAGALSNAASVEIDVRLKGTTGNEVNKVRTVEITRTGQISVK